MRRAARSPSRASAGRGDGGRRRDGRLRAAHRLRPQRPRSRPARRASSRLDEGRGEVDGGSRRCPTSRRARYRFEVNGVGLRADGGFSEKGALDFVEDGRRGYAIVAGRDLSGRPGEVVVEQRRRRRVGAPRPAQTIDRRPPRRAARGRHRPLARQRRLPARRPPRACTSRRSRSCARAAGASRQPGADLGPRPRARRRHCCRRRAATSTGSAACASSTRAACGC